MKHGVKLYEEDRLMFAGFDEHGRYIRQGKRVGASCPLTYDERRAYVLHGQAKAIRLIRERRNLDLHEALKLLNKARYYR